MGNAILYVETALGRDTSSPIKCPHQADKEHRRHRRFLMPGPCLFRIYSIFDTVATHVGELYKFRRMTCNCISRTCCGRSWKHHMGKYKKFSLRPVNVGFRTAVLADTISQICTPQGYACGIYNKWCRGREIIANLPNRRSFRLRRFFFDAGLPAVTYWAFFVGPSCFQVNLFYAQIA